MKRNICILICFVGISTCAATEESKEKFTAILPDGTTIELVGLRNYSYLDLQQFKDGNFPWWRPDGTTIVEPPDTNNWQTSSSESYWFVIRFIRLMGRCTEQIGALSLGREKNRLGRWPN